MTNMIIEDITVEGYKNLCLSGDIKVHEGSYAINIKTDVYPRYLDEDSGNFCIDYMQQSFFDLVELTARAFGYAGFSVEGKSGGWLKPITDFNNQFKTIRAVDTEYVDYYDHIIQEKFWQFSEVIVNLKKKLEFILEYAKSTEQVITLTRRLIENEN